jgi:zinc/manganese transport system substrate-binding protein
MKSVLAAAAMLFAVVPARAAGLPVPVVAAENVYGEVAAAIGGDRVAVRSVIVSAKTDPHDFEPPPSVAEDVAGARVVILNGAGYDHWMERLVQASDNPGRTVINVATLIGAVEGDNPHLWYDPRAVPALAAALAQSLAAVDRAGAAGYESRRKDFVASLQTLNEKITEIRDRYAGTPVTATEPVFGPMAAALGLDMRNEDFQRAVMNETEPSAREIAAFDDDLKNRQVKVLFYNSQVVDPLTEQALAAARNAGVPVVGVTEILPPGKTYLDWMLGELDTTARALAAPSS